MLDSRVYLLQEGYARWLVDALFSDEAAPRPTLKHDHKLAHNMQAFVQRGILTHPQRRIQLRFKFQDHRDSPLLRLMDEFMTFRIRENEQADEIRRAFDASYTSDQQQNQKQQQAAHSQVVKSPAPASLFLEHRTWLTRHQPGHNERLSVITYPKGNAAVYRRRGRQTLRMFARLQLPETHESMLADLSLDPPQLALAVELLTLNYALAWCLQLPVPFRRLISITLVEDSRLIDALAHLDAHLADDLFSCIVRASPFTGLDVFCSLFATDLLVLRHQLDAFESMRYTIDK
jgi:hypothetical protein